MILAHLKKIFNERFLSVVAAFKLFPQKLAIEPPALLTGFG